MKIKTLIYGLVLSVAVPLVGVTSFVIGTNYYDDRRGALQNVESLTASISDRIGRTIANAETVLTLLASRSFVRTPDPDSCSATLKYFQDANPRRANVGVIDHAGRTICSAVPLPGGQPTDVSDTDWYRRVMTENRFIVSGTFRGRITGRLVAVTAYPVRDDDGTPIGAVTMPHEISELLPPESLKVLPPGASITIIDRDGVVVTRQPESEWSGRNIRKFPIVDAVLSKGIRTRIGTMGTDVESAFYFVPVDSAEWMVIAAIPTGVMFAQTRANIIQSAGMVIAVLVVVFFLSWLLIRRITRPIDEIAETSRAISNGRLDVRMPPQTQEEFASAARQFNEMLDIREQSEKRFRQVLESAPDAMIVVDHDGIIRFVNRQVERLFGYSQAELVDRPIEMLLPRPLRDLHVHHRREYAKAPKARPMGQGLHLRAVAQDGREFPVEISLSPLETAEGALTCCAVRDISERAADERRIRQLNRLYSALTRTSHAITHLSDPNALLEEVCRIAVEHGELRLAWIGFVDTASEEVNVAAHFGQAEGYLDDLRVSTDPARATGRGPIATAIREGRAVFSSDLDTDARTARWREAVRLHGLRSSAAFPLTRDGTVIGSLNLYSGETVYFDDPELTGLLSEMAAELSFALEGLERTAAKDEAELRFKQIAENTRDVFWLTDPAKGQMLYVSPAYSAVWGRDTAALYASPRAWFDGIHAEDRARILEVATTQQALGTYDEEYRIVRPDGGIRWIHDRAFPVRNADGTVYRIAGIAEDITERKLDEVRIRDSERRLESVLNSTSDACVVLDRSYTFTYLNPVAERLLRRSRAELIGKNIFDEFPDAIGTPFETKTRTAMEENRAAAFEAYYQPFEAFFEVHEFPTEDGLSVFFRDVTASKAAERRLQQAQRMEALGTMAGGIAHDFNNLLLPILTMAEQSKEDLPGDHIVQANLSLIVDASQQAARLIEQILTFGRRNGHNRAPVEISSSIDEALQLFRSVVPPTVKIVRNIEPNVGVVIADKAQLQSVVMNVGTNAIQAMQGRPGTIFIGVARRANSRDVQILHPMFRNKGEHAVITIEDTGSGMDEETRRKIFDPFFTTKEVGEGTGLGLAMVHGIVERLNGAIDVVSSPGVGTTFKIYLPLNNAPSARPDERDDGAATG